ncbi:putative DNA-binding transcriptional regulator AlpA [Pseudomonas corrugata]|jgi:predicted DNA-binding transcriptional regulator AlpA|nr:putative DNA-binding transcriptional regulator AlpA [Pseudomonas corrugata]
MDVGNKSRKTIKGSSVAVLEAEEQRTVGGDRKVELKVNDYLQVASSSHTRVAQTVVVEAGQQVHLKEGAHVILDAGAGLTLKGDGQHIVIGLGGIFSSVPIVQGGAPVTDDPAPSSSTTNPRRILRLPEVMATVGFGRAHIYNLMAEGKFPKAKRISLRAVGWDSRLIDEFVAQQLEG